MSIKVMVLITASAGGGAESFVLDCAGRHTAAVEPTVVTLRRGNAEEIFAAACGRANVEYISLDRKSKFSFGAIGQLAQIVRRKGIGVVHAHLIEAEFHAWLLRFLVPSVRLVFTKHNTNPFRKGIAGRLDGLVSRKADALIAVSESLAGFLGKHEGIPAGRMTVIPNGIRIDDFAGHISREESRQRLNLPADAPVVGIVGRLTHQKNHRTLLEAVRKAKDTIPALKLLIVGEGELEQELRRAASTLGIGNDTIFLGFRRDIADIYPAFDMICLPSLYEGFGRVLVEAALCGAFAIAGDVDGPREIVRDGTDGFLVTPTDPDALAEKILWVLENPGKAAVMVRSAQERAREMFDIEQVERRIEKVYAEVPGK